MQQAMNAIDNRPGDRQLPAILALALAILWAATGIRAAEIKMSQPNPSLIEITGGEGKSAWRLQYGTRPDLNVHKGVYPAGDDRAYFAHGLWLRLIDTKKGQVIGRWRFPGQIVRLVPDGAKATVFLDIEGPEKNIPQSVAFDSAAPAIPDYPTGFLFCYLLPANETFGPCDWPNSGHPLGNVTPERARQLIPAMEEAIRRDPLSPWFRMVLGKLLQDAGDSRAAEVTKEGIELSTADYSDLLRMSAMLEARGQWELGSAAFEHGYAGFIQRGYDPRLFTSLFGRLLIHGAVRPEKLSPEWRPVYLDQLYRLAPRAEGASFAWQLYANWLARNGQAEQARLWQARADETRHPMLLALGLDHTLYLVLASILAAMCYMLVFGLRYRPQMRLDAAARKRSGARASAFPNAYATRGERLTLLAIVLIGWLAAGVGGLFVHAVVRLYESPMSDRLGKFSSPATLANFQSLSPTPERDLLLAVGYQQAGQTDAAERLYRNLTQFPQTWNNLGVLLKERGKEPEARRAFERALAADPALAEAALNLGRAPHGFWTEIHQKYLPGRAMLAVPTERQYHAAFLAATPGRVIRDALGGPFSGLWERRLAGSTAGGSALFGYEIVPATAKVRGLALFLITVLLFAAAVLLILPRREVSEPPGRRQYVWEIAFPGTAPAWGLASALVLVAWCYLLLQAALAAWSYVSSVTRFYNPISYIQVVMPNLPLAYALPDSGYEQVYRLLTPGWAWLYLAPALLFAANAVAVLWSRSSPRSRQEH